MNWYDILWFHIFRKSRKTTHKTLTKWAARSTSRPWRPDEGPRMPRSLFHHGWWRRTQVRADNTLSLYEPAHRTASNQIIYNIRASPLFHCSSLSSFLPSSSTRHLLLHSSSDEQVVVVGPWSFRGDQVNPNSILEGYMDVVPGHGDLDILLVILYKRVKVPSVRSILYSTTWWG